MKEHLSESCENIKYKTNNGILIKHYRGLVKEAMHWHNAIELIVPLDKNCNVKLNNEILSLKAHDILFIFPCELHFIETTDNSCNLYILQIDYNSFCINNNIREILHALKPYFLINSQKNLDLANIINNYADKIENEYNNSLPFYEAYIYALSEEILALIGRYSLKFAVENNNSKSPNSQNTKTLNYYNELSNDDNNINIKNINDSKNKRHNLQLFFSLCEYINSNYANNPTLESAAKLTGYSRSHFCRFFRDFSGKSYYDYLLEIKVSNAASLLCKTDKKIAVIALSCGFNSVSTFNRVFHQYYKCSPTEYRTRNYV